MPIREFSYISPLTPKKKNPYRREVNGLPNKKKWIILLGIFAILLALGLLLFHPFFLITRDRIIIHGLVHIKQDHLQNTVESAISTRRWYLFPGKSYPFIDAEDIRDILTIRYSLDSITIKKIFPHTLTIDLEEKVSTILYDSRSRYAFVGLSGRVIELLRPPVPEDSVWRIVSTTHELATSSSAESAHEPPTKDLVKAFGDYPIVSAPGEGISLELGTRVFATGTAEMITNWFRLLKRDMGISIAYMRLESAPHTATFKTAEGWEIRVRLDEHTREQSDLIRTVLRDPAVRRGGLEYIDVRYAGRVYWQ